MGEINIYPKLNMCAASHRMKVEGRDSMWRQLHIRIQKGGTAQHAIFLKMFRQLLVCVCIFYRTFFYVILPFRSRKHKKLSA